MLLRHSRVIRLWVCITLCASLWLSMPPLALRNTLETALVTHPQIGLNTHIATRMHYLQTIATASRVIAESGSQWVREDIHWYRVQRTPTAYEWQFYDQTFDELTQHNVNILAVLGHPPGWATPNPTDDPYNNSFSAPDIDRFAAWAATTVARYQHQVHYWQIWNEPDNPLFWQPSPDPVAYARLVIATSRAIKKVAPAAVIVSAGFNPFNMAFMNRAAEAGIWAEIDVVAIHPYVNPEQPAYSGLHQAVYYIDGLQHRYGRRPIWVTEIGWASGLSDRDPPNATPAQQATYLTESMQILWHAGVDVVFWYTFKDEAHNPYGLIAWGHGSDDMQPRKPAFYAFQQLSSASIISTSVTHIPITSFEGRRQTWVRGDEPYGTVRPQQAVVSAGRTALQIDYAFPRYDNRYVVFRHRRPLIIPPHTTAITLMLYGNNQAHELKLWLKGSDGAIVQLQMAPLGGHGWRQVTTRIPTQFAPWDQITAGDGTLHPPITIEAIVLDDNPNGSGQSGTFYIDQLSAIVSQ